MADQIDALIARPPAFNYNELADPLQGYKQGREVRLAREQESNRRSALTNLPVTADGTPNYNEAVRRLADLGDFEGVQQLAPLAHQQTVENRTGQSARNFDARWGGGGSTAPQNPSGFVGPMPTPPAADVRQNPSAVPASGNTATASRLPPSQEWGPMPGPTDPTMTIHPRTIAEANAPATTSQNMPPAPMMAPSPSGPVASAPVYGAPQAPPNPNAVGGNRVPGPAQTANPVAGNIRDLIASVRDQYLPQAQRDLAKVMLEHALRSSDLPENQRNYGLYLSQGGTDDFTTWDRKNKQAGATAITTDMRGERAEQAELGKGAGTRANTTMGAMQTATRTLANLSRVQTLLDNVDQGKLEPARMSVSAWARAFGLTDEAARSLGLNPQAVGDAQALNALRNDMVIGRIGAGGFPANNFSDADRSFLTDTVPSLANEPRGNRIMIEVARRAAHLDIEKGRAWQAFRRDPGNTQKSYDDFEAGWADQISRRDMFGDLQREAQGLIGQPANGPGNRPAVQPPQQNVVPPALRARPVEDQLRNAPENTRATINGQRMIKRNGQWVPNGQQ